MLKIDFINYLLGHAAFQENQLTSVSIGESVTEIGSQAFYLNQLTSVIINSYSTDVTIGNNAFGWDKNSGCTDEICIKWNTPFAQDSWDTIASNIKNGNINRYKVGEIRVVDLGEYGKRVVRIANLPSKTDEEEDKCGTNGFSETACGFVIEFVDIITTHNMNDTDKNEGGWEASAMRKFVTPVKDKNGSVIEGTGTIYNALPEDLRNNIIETKVISGHGSTTGEENFVTQDKLYLLSTKEVWGKADTTNVINTDKAEAETRQLDYYIQNGVTTESSKYAPAIKKYNGTATKYWLRSAHSGNTYSFFDVYTSGDWSYGAVVNAHGVAVAFRIG